MRYLGWICGTALALALSACGGDERQASVMTRMAAMQGSASAQAVVTETLAGKRADYQVSLANGRVTVTRAASGETRTLAAGVQRLRFDDGTLVLDIEDKAGTVYRVYQAAFDRQPDTLGYTFWLQTADSGASIASIAAEFVKSEEFRKLYGAAPSNRDLLSRYYQNVLHRTPDQAGFDYWLNLLDTGAATPTTLLAEFADSKENKDQVGAAIRNGVWLPADTGPQTIDALYTVTSVGVKVQEAPIYEKTYPCASGQCQASLYCEAPLAEGESETERLRIVLDPARKTATFTLDDETIHGTYEPNGSAPAKVVVEAVYDDEEVLNTGSVRFYSSGKVRLELSYDPATRRFSGTVVDRVANRWTLDNHVAECSATSNVTAVPVSS